MKLTQYTNYALRTLMYVSINGGKPASVHEISDAYKISANHLKKAANEMVKQGYLKTMQGRHGGLLMAKKPKAINIGKVIRITEGTMNIVECFDLDKNTCPAADTCSTSDLFKRAISAFLDVLDSVTLADMIENPNEMREILGIDLDKS